MNRDKRKLKMTALLERGLTSGGLNIRISYSKIVIALLFFLFSSFTRAQDYIDIFSVDYSVSPSNQFDSSKATTHLQKTNGDLTIPVKISDRFAFLTGVTYGNVSAAFDPGKGRTSMTGMALKLGANVKHHSKWSGTYMLLPKISSDLNQLSRRDFQFGGAVLMKYQQSENFNYKMGLYANRELFGTFLVPMFGLYYQDPSEKFEAKVLLPLSVDFNYSMTPSFRVGLHFNGQVRSYNLNNSQASEADQYLTRSTNDIESYLRYETNKGINFQMGVGHSVGRSYRIYDETVSLGVPLAYIGDNRRPQNSDFADGWFVKATVFYRLKLDNSTDDRSQSM